MVIVFQHLLTAAAWDHPLQMAFFQNRSLSLVDMYIDTSEPTENVGEIQFSLEYNFNKMTLIIRIMQVSLGKYYNYTYYYFYKIRI